MFHFLHTFHPHPILISFGPFNIFYYGFFIVCGILLGSIVILKLAEQYQLDKNIVMDSAFVVVLSAIAGGRLYHVFLESDYYWQHPLNIIMLWRGGLAIHGAIIGGLLAIYLFARKHKVNFLLLTSLYTPALALGQTLGRWGNYFNQELYGLPTNQPWGIPIEVSHRILAYRNYTFFHPTFLYESMGNLFIFIILLLLHRQLIKKKSSAYSLVIAVYLFFYSLLRFSLEFIRIDKTPELFNLRFPQIASLVLASLALYIFYQQRSAIYTLFSSSIKSKKK